MCLCLLLQTALPCHCVCSSMLLAGGLLALEKYAKWKVFNIIPPLVWIYVLNMAFCTMGLFNSRPVPPPMVH